MLFGQGQPEDAHEAELLDERHWNEQVPAMPVLGEWQNLLRREALELVPDHVQAFVGQAPIAELAVGDQGCEAGAPLRRAALGDRGSGPLRWPAPTAHPRPVPGRGA